MVKYKEVAKKVLLNSGYDESVAVDMIETYFRYEQKIAEVAAFLIGRATSAMACVKNANTAAFPRMRFSSSPSTMKLRLYARPALRTPFQPRKSNVSA